MRPARVISGGQCGADQAGLRAAKTCGIETGGFAPYRWKTERGPAAWLGTRYGLVELGNVDSHGASQYLPRTIKNIEAADLTICFGDLRFGGTLATVKAAQARDKYVLQNPQPMLITTTTAVLAGKLGRGVIVNIAGNRESRNPGIDAWVYWVLVTAWGGDAGDEPFRPRLLP